jgi:hypothetical protein
MTIGGKLSTISSVIALLVAIPLYKLQGSAAHAEEPRNEMTAQPGTLKEAFNYAFPIYEMMRLRWSYIEDPDNPLPAKANGITHGRALIDYTRRVVTTPNNDTLYSRTILDL